MPHPLRPDSAFVSAQWKNRVPEPQGPPHGVDNPQTGYLRFLLDKYLQGKVGIVMCYIAWCEVPALLAWQGAVQLLLAYAKTVEGRDVTARQHRPMPVVHGSMTLCGLTWCMAA
jgi:hypothetical protein